MTLGKYVRSITVGLLLAVLGIGLLPFLFVFYIADVNGLTLMDPTPIFTLVSKFINGSSVK